MLWKTDVRGSANAIAVCGKQVFVAAGMLYKLRRSDGKIEAPVHAALPEPISLRVCTDRPIIHGGGAVWLPSFLPAPHTCRSARP
jgi:hypothetical protein